MTTYNYSCEKCGEFEIEHKMNEIITICPNCNSTNIKRLISKGTSFILLGDSWAKTNYK